MRRITSRQNPVVAEYRAAAEGNAPDLLLLDGLHLVHDALAAGLRLRQIMVSAEALTHAEIAPLIARATAAGINLVVGSAPVMAAVSPVRSTSPIVGLAERPSRSSLVFEAAAPLVLVACDVQDPGNLGAIIRVAEAAGASGLIAAGRCADPLGWKALRGSMGSALRLPIATMPDVSEALLDVRRHRCRVVATVPRGGRSLFKANLKGPIAVFIGSEGQGLPAAIADEADERLTIPMETPVESLNAATTAALIAYEARRQRA